MTRLRAAVVACFVVLLAACGKAPLYSQLGEREANEMTAVLDNAGIDASKSTPDGGKSWEVRVSADQFAAAVEALRAWGYPREQFKTLCDVFKREGFVSSALEERARLMCGLQQELSRTLSLIDGVVEARVHIAVPERDPLSEKIRPSSASVFIKYRPDVSLTQAVPDIKAMVVNSIEGLPFENVTVKLFAADPAAVRPPPRTLSEHEKVQTAVGVALAVAVLGVCVFYAWRKRREIVQRFAADRRKKPTRYDLRPVAQEREGSPRRDRARDRDRDIEATP